MRFFELELFAETWQFEPLLLFALLLLLFTLLLFALDACNQSHVFQLRLYAVINLFLQLLIHFWHDLLHDHLLVILLLRVFTFIAVSPYIVEVLIEFVKLLDDLARANLNDLFLVIISLSFFALFLLSLFLSILFLPLGLPFFLFSRPFGFFLLWCE